MIYLRIVLLVPVCEVQNEAGLGHVTDPVAEGEKDVIVACPDHGLVHGLDVDIRFQADLDTLEIEAGERVPFFQGRDDVVPLAGVVHDGEGIPLLDRTSRL